MDIKTTNFIEKYANEVINENAAVFIGAGFSKTAGFVDWKSLLKDITKELELDIDKENNLTSIAQYYVNKNGRSGINDILSNEFLQDREPGKNHKILSKIPIKTYWTTNYDSLLEDALKNEGKIVDVKYCNEHLARTVPNRNVVLYKMHGDKSNPSTSVLIKDDYERYYKNYAPFITALSGDLSSKTFLFMGLSFKDPNLDYILSRMRVEYGEKCLKQHYAIFREISNVDYQDAAEYTYDLKRQKLFFDDLKRYAIRPIIVKEYSEITEILICIDKKINAKSTFISGSAYEYGTWNEKEAIHFIEMLSEQLIKEHYNIVSGFGLGVGSFVITGALKQIYMGDKKIDERRLLLRPFPQGILDESSRKELWTIYRKDMISHSGIVIFMFGNKKSDNGQVVDANGMMEEFNIAVKQGKLIIPIACTGYASLKIWDTVSNDIPKYFKKDTPQLKSLFMKLNEKTTSEILCQNIIKIIKLIV